MNATHKTKYSRRLLLGAAAMALAFSGSAALAAATGIASTKHNLTASGPKASGNGSTDQICVFCHTPHGSDTSAPVPLWNRKLGAQGGASYTLYSSLGTATLKGEVLTVGSVSLACLSCHDGTQAMNNLINGPGSGNYNAAGAAFGTWTAGAGGRGAGGIIGDSNPVPNLGTDLTNDHPIGVAYCGGGLAAATDTDPLSSTFNEVIVQGTCKNPDFISPTNTTTSDSRAAAVKTASINSKQMFWVDVDGNVGRGKGDILLYTRSFTGAANTPSVECGSCHDPHQDSTVDSTLNFMRVTTAGSKICLSCHVK